MVTSKAYLKRLRQLPYDPCLTTNDSLGLGVGFTEAGKSREPEKDP